MSSEKGIATAAKKEKRIAAEGLCQIKEVGNTAVIVEVNSDKILKKNLLKRNEKAIP
mgnify:CR=1 FL=1